ncbi:MAG: hypothetical protein IJJ56_06965 [Prevotella sp.]|nr:hypothetical protein [Prevotella sp.]
MKKVLWIICCVTLFSCNSKPQKSWEELRQEEQEYYDRQKANEDSIKRAKHNEIEKKLSVTDGGHILGDIVLGMSKKEYELALQKFDKEVGRVDIEGQTFGVVRSYDYPVFKDGKLVKVALVSGYSTSMRLPDKNGSASDIEINDPGKKIKSNMYKHLYAKYGEADSISRNKEPTNVSNFDYARWEYSFKIIEIKEELSSVSQGYGGRIEDYRLIYIVYSDPKTFKRDEFVADSIMQERIRFQNEQKKKEKAYSEQL